MVSASQLLIKTVIAIVMCAVFGTWIKQNHHMVLDTYLLVKLNKQN